MGFSKDWLVILGTNAEPKKPSKYRAVKVEIDGVVFDSKKEGRRYQVLKAELDAGLISNMRVHVSFDLKIGDVLICRYEADFVYFRDGLRVVEDTKGMRTEVYKLKRKLMKALHDIDVLET
jgi:hypothetical protein